ncbi:type II secretion system F family protein [Streptomyces sp. NPDC002564]|uniref:type II secretion system F family protein n=1 Tax=Streptomyces sp. NPDC002564 TaxID=3364649 RepID=UPI00367C9715
MNVVHRLGVTVWVVAAALWLTLTLLTAHRERKHQRRAARALTAHSPPARHLLRRVPGLPRAKEWLTAAGAASAAYALVGGVPGLLIAAAVGYGVRRHLHGKGATPRDLSRHPHAAAQLPLAADLLASCVAAGASPVTAAQAVGESLQGPVGSRLARGAAEVRLGGEPGDAWRHLAAIPGAAPLARLLERSGESGAPAAAPVARLAADARAARGRAATEAARRAAVLMTAPVGLCFLPAFVAVGVLPVVIGLADGLLNTP